MNVRRFTVTPSFLDDRQASDLVFGAAVAEELRKGADRVEIVVEELIPVVGYIVETLEATE